MEKPFHEWTRNELRTKERVYPIADEYGEEIRAEISVRSRRPFSRSISQQSVALAVDSLLRPNRRRLAHRRSEITTGTDG